MKSDGRGGRVRNLRSSPKASTCSKLRILYIIHYKHLKTKFKKTDIRPIHHTNVKAFLLYFRFRCNVDGSSTRSSYSVQNDKVHKNKSTTYIPTECLLQQTWLTRTSIGNAPKCDPTCNQEAFAVRNEKTKNRVRFLKWIHCELCVWFEWIIEVIVNNNRTQDIYIYKERRTKNQKCNNI